MGCAVVFTDLLKAFSISYIDFVENITISSNEIKVKFKCSNPIILCVYEVKAIIPFSIYFSIRSED